MTALVQNLNRLRSEIDEKGVKLVAVSKYHPVDMLREAYDAGQRIFGESHVQELEEKQKVLPTDIEWHFIGHLQTNKVRLAVQHAAMIQSVDSARLLALIREYILLAVVVGVGFHSIAEVYAVAHEPGDFKCREFVLLFRFRCRCLRCSRIGGGLPCRGSRGLRARRR